MAPKKAPERYEQGVGHDVLGRPLKPPVDPREGLPKDPLEEAELSCPVQGCKGTIEVDNEAITGPVKVLRCTEGHGPSWTPAHVAKLSEDVGHDLAARFDVKTPPIL